MDLKEEYNKTIKDGFYEFYSVGDNFKDTDEIIFILESGHIEEVNNHKPLCGDSGKKFSYNILGKDVAVGFLNKSNIPKIGFMESSPIPLWLLTYEYFSENPNAPIQKEDYSLVYGLTAIKEKYDTLSNPTLKELYEFKFWLKEYLSKTKLYEYYEQRLNTLWNKNKHFVICGIIAQAFFEKFIDIEPIEGYKTYFEPKEFIKKDENYVLFVKHPVNWNKFNTKIINKELNKTLSV